MTIKWTKIKDPDDGMNEYSATVDGTRFYIYHSTDAGFGLAASREDGKQLLNHGALIEWRGTLRKCKERAEAILEREMAT